MKRQFFILLILIALHTLSLWNWEERIAGQFGDPLAHAAIGQWFCKNVVAGDFHSNQFLYPVGADLSGNYDSPFPFILTCPFVELGSAFQFHLFILIQIILIVFSASMVARLLLKDNVYQFLYVLFVWWCGYYIVRSHQHMTLLSNIWGVQWIFYGTIGLQKPMSSRFWTSMFLLGLSFSGTFQNIPSLSILMGVLWGWRVLSAPRNERVWLRELWGLALVGLIMLFFWWPMIYFTFTNGLPDLAAQRNLYNLDLLSPLQVFQTHFFDSWFPERWKLTFERSNPFNLLIFILLIISLCQRSFWRSKQNCLLFFLAMAYFILALGPELRVGNQVVLNLPLNQILFEWLPLRLTRTPARLAVVTELLFILLAFRYLDDHHPKQSTLKALSAIWIFTTGPIFNQLGFFPTFRVADYLPVAALKKITTFPNHPIVVQIPSAWAQDPSQNFQQLLHGRPTTAGYLAYPVYTRKIHQQFSADDFLGALSCDERQTPLLLKRSLFMDLTTLKLYLQSRNFTVFVIQKGLLMNDPNCAPLKEWIRLLLQQNWIEILDENKFYLVAKIKNSN